VLGRIALAMLAAAAISVVIRAWDPPFPYRTGFVPSHDIVSRVGFSKEDTAQTEAARERVRSRVRYVYIQDAVPLEELRASLKNTVIELTSKTALAEVDPRVWQEFGIPEDEDATPETQDAQFREFRATFAGQENLERFDRAAAAAFTPFEQRGLLDTPPQAGRGNQEEILVHPRGALEPRQVVKTADVLMGDATAFQQSLRLQFESPMVADRLFAWIKPKLKPTLAPDETENVSAFAEMEEAIQAVKPVLVNYLPGRTLAKAGQPLSFEQVQVLHTEYEAARATRSRVEQGVRTAVVAVMIFALFVLCGIYMRYRQRGPLASVTRLTTILLLAIVTVAAGRVMSREPWRAEIIPLLLFGMTIAIAYRQELALLLAAVLAFVLTVAIGHGLREFLLLSGVTTVAVLNVGRIRTRSKLIYVGLGAGGVAALLYLGLSVLDNQPVSFDLLGNAGRWGLWVLAAGFLMTGLLPFIEHLFGVLTDLSLLELGDVTHPLLQELVRRAPSTYNHSITVGAIAEAAAESIGARGLLVRVGAYFHDIGKMLKPGYFIENQGSESSRHESLVPAMSTLVIIAHLKDGADLARQHRLPQPIIDLIAQHHGTTLVEFFFDRAHEQQQQSDPNGAEVDESTFRYPGPKPQTKESAVLMLADTVESASRTLVDPTPARIESLVRDLAEHRLHGGQFDDSGLTLRELRTIEKSMVMSLISIYHGRIKYPEQRTA
jgi:cyclic-di-AMP phosphodiesterase PgpH